MFLQPHITLHVCTPLQTISNTVANLQENQAVFRIFIALLRFSFESPSYNAAMNKISTAVLSCNESTCRVALDLHLLHASQQTYLICGNPLLHGFEHPTIVTLHAQVFEQLCHTVGILQVAVTGEVCCYTLKHNLYCYTL
jgi:hypothetical protein